MGKDIRNYEFKVNNGQVYFNDKGDIKFKGKGKKELKQLQPLFDAIMKADDSYKSNDKKLDSAKEKDLMDKLHKLLMADGIVDANELKLGDEFTKSGLTAEAFINTKFDEANKKAEPKDYAALDAAIEETIEKEEPVDKVVDQQTSAEDSTLINNSTVVADDTAVETPARPDPRVSANAFNDSIQNEAARIAGNRDQLEAEFTNVQTIKKGSTLYNIALDALKAEGVENPTPRQINTRIAEIAMLNNIPNVNNVRIGTSLKVGRGNVPDAGEEAKVENQGAASEGGGAQRVATSSVAPSTITVSDKTPEETLTELEYSAEERSVEAEGEEEGFDYKEWTKEDSVNMYTTEVDGTTLAAESLDKLKEIRTEYKNAAVKGTPEEEETDEAKAARQTENLANMKKQIELSCGNINVIKDVIAQLRGDGNVDLKSAEVQAFVQDLVRTKNVEVLRELLAPENADGNNEFVKDLIKNEETAKTVVSLYNEIRAKENAGEKLTNEEIALKEFYKDTVVSNDLYEIDADDEKGIVAKTMKTADILGEAYYSATIEDVEYTALDSAILDAFAKDLSEAGTDEEKKSAVFKKYAQTDDKVFAQTLASQADALNASKEDVEALIAKNDMYVLQGLSYTPAAVVGENELYGFTPTDKTDGEGDDAFAYKEYTKTEGDVTTTVYTATVGDKEIKANSLEELKQAVADYKEFNNTVAARVETIYTEAAGDPANMCYLEEAFAKIDATDKTDVEKRALKDKILETYFDVEETTEGEGEEAATTKSYTFKPSRRPTYEEMRALYEHLDNKTMFEAIVNSVKVDDMGKGQWVSAIEGATVNGEDCCTMLREHFGKLISDMTAEEIVDFIKNKMQEYKDYNIPYDSIIAKFPEDLAEQTDLVSELLENVTGDSVIDDANRVKLLNTIIDADGNLTVPDGVLNSNLIQTLPADCSADGAKTCFDKVLAKLGDNIDDIKELANRVTDPTSQVAIQAKLTDIVNANKANPDVVLKVMNLGISAIPEMKDFVALEFTNEAWKPEQKAQVFEKIFDGGILMSNREEFLQAAVKSGLAVDKGNHIYQVTGTDYGYDTWWGTGDGDARVANCFKISLNGLGKVDKLFNSPSIGEPNITDLLRGNKEGYENYLNKDNIVTILRAAANGNKTGIMEQMAGITDDAWYKFGFGGKGTKPGQALMNRIPKAVMRKALEAGLGDTDEYKALAGFFGAEGTPKYNQDGTIAADDAYKFTKNDDAKGEYTVEQAKELDTLINKLINQIICSNNAV